MADPHSLRLTDQQLRAHRAHRLSTKRASPTISKTSRLGSDEHRALHPFMLIPAMRHGDLTLFETLGYRDLCRPGLRRSGPGARRSGRGRAHHAMDQCRSTMSWLRHLGRSVIFERLAKPHFDMETDEARITEAMPHVERIMEVFGETLSAAPYFGGADATLADAYMIGHMFYASICPDTEKLVAGNRPISDWLARMNERESVKSTVPSFG